MGTTSFPAVVTASLHWPAGTDWFGLFCYIPGPGSEYRCPRVDGGNHQKCYYLPQRKLAMLGAQLDAPDYLSHLHKVLKGIDLTALQTWSDAIYDAWEHERFVYIIGNGGSGTTASHMAEDLGKSTLREEDLRDESRRRLKVLSLTDNAGWLLAVGNDLGYDQIFVQQLMNYGQAGDLLIAISGSGNSPNVLEAVDWANRHDLKTFALTGFDGGKLHSLGQTGLHVPLDDMGMVESVHLCLFHWVLDDLFGRINHQGRYASN
jgi:D-sedoheptulose 7-phosphate isomerase